MYKIAKLDFSNILCVTRWVYEKKTTMPCFAILVKKSPEPFVFLSQSENKMSEWINQITIYITKLSEISSNDSALTLTNEDGHAYYGFLDNGCPKLIQQIGKSIS